MEPIADPIRDAESVTIEGQVAFPGNYGFTEGERLSSILRRAGGFRDTAYPAGAILVREQVRELEQKSREELIRQIETSSAAARLSPNQTQIAFAVESNQSPASIARMIALAISSVPTAVGSSRFGFMS